MAAASASPTAAPGPGRVGSRCRGAAGVGPIDRAAGALPATTTPPTGAAAAGAPQAPPAAAKEGGGAAGLLKLVKKNFPADQVGNAMAVARSVSQDSDPSSATPTLTVRPTGASSSSTTLGPSRARCNGLASSSLTFGRPDSGAESHHQCEGGRGDLSRSRVGSLGVCVQTTDCCVALHERQGSDVRPLLSRWRLAGGSLKPSDAALARRNRGQGQGETGCRTRPRQTLRRKRRRRAG